MKARPLSLSEGLSEMRCLFDRYRETPQVLPPEHASIIQRCCDVLIARAAELERGRRIETSRLLAAIRQPGSNVALFPVVPRPVRGRDTAS